MTTATGMVDLADPTCCLGPSSPLPLGLRAARLASGRDGLAVDLRADLDTTAFPTTVPPAAAVAL